MTFVVRSAALIAVSVVAFVGLAVALSTRGVVPPRESVAATQEPAGAVVTRAAPAPSRGPADVAAPVTLTDDERRGELVESPRYGECRGIVISVDEVTPTVESAIETASTIIVGIIEEVGGGRYNTPNNQMLTADDRPTEFDAYRPAIVRLEHLVAGRPVAEVVKVRLPGGQVGCDSYHHDKTPGVEAGGRYVLFLDQRTDAKGNAIDEMTVVRAWSINESGHVITPYDGNVPLDELVNDANR